MGYGDSLIDKQCDFCGKKFSARKCDIARGWGRFCSRKCSAANALTMRRPGESRNRLHAIAREIYIERNGDPICAVCGAEQADIHHINENICDNAPENLTALCRSCHVSYHNRVSPKRQKDVNE